MKESQKNRPTVKSALNTLLGFNIVVNDKIEPGTIYLVGDKVADERLSKEERAKYLVKLINVKA